MHIAGCRITLSKLTLTQRVTIGLVIIILMIVSGLVWRKQLYQKQSLQTGLLYLPIPQNHPNLLADDDQVELEETTYEALFREVGQRYDLDWRMLAEQAYQESKFDHLAIGQAGEMGLMQIQPDTWLIWAGRTGATDPFDPYHNLLVAAAYLDHWGRYLTQEGYPEPYWALVAYNWGPGNLQQFLDQGQGWSQIPNTTRQYSLNIVRQSQDTAIPPLLWAELQTKVNINRNAIDNTARQLPLTNR